MTELSYDVMAVTVALAALLRSPPVASAALGASPATSAATNRNVQRATRAAGVRAGRGELVPVRLKCITAPKDTCGYAAEITLDIPPPEASPFFRQKRLRLGEKDVRAAGCLRGAIDLGAVARGRLPWWLIR